LRVKKWFEIFVHGFSTGIDLIDSAICLKVKHTENVAREILDISNSLGLGPEDCFLAEIIAILHDTGRFEQFARYHTYSDTKSENHALLGVNIINNVGVLDGLDPMDSALIGAVVSYHNCAVVPETEDMRFLFFLKLLRDADKIDILRVVTDHYQGLNTNDAIEIGLPDTPGVSQAIVQCLIHGKIARVEDMKTLNDFKLLQAGWIFDINFPRTFEIIKNRKYLDKIYAVLPQTDDVTQAVLTSRQHLEKNSSFERTCSKCPIH